jgi:hypothetical protein
VRLRPIRSALTEILIENESMVEILSPDFGRIFGLSRADKVAAAVAAATPERPVNARNSLAAMTRDARGSPLRRDGPGRHRPRLGRSSVQPRPQAIRSVCLRRHVSRPRPRDGTSWVFALANDICLMIEAKVLVETAGSSPVNEREQAYGPALTHFVEGARTAAVAVLDRHLMRSRLTLWCIGVPR